MSSPNELQQKTVKVKISKKPGKQDQLQNGFISFSTVSAGAIGPNTAKKNVTAPVYSGSDPELLQSSRKLIKKDSTTKLKALQEVIAILSTRESYILHDFLPYFAYVYCRLSMDNDRQVRELVNVLLGSVVTLDKKQLSPYMSQLIGYWWCTTCDPAKEVASKAAAVFSEAIPSKKRQQVLLHLAPHILRRCARNLSHTAATLSGELAGDSTADEAEERYERVVVSSIACVGSLVSSLDRAQALVLWQGVECSSDEDGPADAASASTQGLSSVLSGAFWKKFLSSKSSPIQKAACELLVAVAAQVPEALDFNSNEASAAKGFASSVASLLDDRHCDSLGSALNAFLAAARCSTSGLWQHVSVFKTLVPRLKHLLQLDADTTLEYLVPLLGSLPVRCVALGEQAEGAASESDELSVQSVCGLLRAVAEVAESRSSSGALVTGAKADACVCEIATLMLLRRDVDSSRRGLVCGDTSGARDPARLGAVFELLVQSAVLGVQTAARCIAVSVGPSFPDQWAAADLLAVTWTAGKRPRALSVLRDDAVEAAEAVGRVLTSLQRATAQEINYSRAVWERLFWQPFSEELTQLLLASCSPQFALGSLGPAAAEGNEDWTAVAVNCTSVAKAAVHLLRGALESSAEKIGDGLGGDSQPLGGVETVATRLLQFSYQSATASTGSAETRLHLVPRMVLGRVLTAAVGRHVAHRLTEAVAAAALTPVAVATALAESLVGEAVEAIDSPAKSRQLAVMAERFLSDLFHFIDTAIAADDDDGRRVPVSLVLRAFTAAESLRAVNAFLSSGALCERFDWSICVDVRVWIEETAVRLLGDCGTSEGVRVQDLNDCDKLTFLTLIVSCRSLEAQSAIVLERALAQWESSSSKLATLFVLTTLAHSLRNRRDSGSIYNHCHHVLLTDPLEWLSRDASAASLRVVASLVSLFFGRVRGADNISRSQATERHGDLLIVDSWAAAQSVLVPLLPAEVADEVSRGLCAALSESLAASSAAGLQPRKWTRHLAAAMDLALRRGGSECAIFAARSVALFQAERWKGFFVGFCGESGSVSRVAEFEFSVECLCLLLGGEEREASGEPLSPSWLPLVRDPTLVLEICVCMEQAAICFAADSQRLVDKISVVAALCLRLAGHMRAAPTWLNDLLAHAADCFCVSAVSPSERAARSSCCISVVRRMLEAHLSVSAVAGDSELVWLNMPQAADRLEKGARLHYIQQQLTDDTNHSNRGQQAHMTLSLVPARLLATHKEAGAEPFYTVELQQQGPAGNCSSREIQTEWHRLLLHDASLNAEAVDLCAVIRLSDGAAGRQLPSTAGESREDDSASVGCAVTRWLAVSIDSQTSALLGDASLLKATDSETFAPLTHRLRLFCAVFSVVCKAVEIGAVVDGDMWRVDVVARLRGLTTFLLGLNHDAFLRAWALGAELLGALLSTRMGVGAGLWLPQAIQALRSVVSVELRMKALSATTEQDRAKVDSLFGRLACAMADILHAAQCNVLQSLAEQLLPVALSSLPSSMPSLAPALLRLLRAVWSSKHRARQSFGGISRSKERTQTVSNVAAVDGGNALLDGLVLPWELEGFDLALYVLANGLGGQGDSARLDAVSALHFCMIDRSRTSAAALLEPSLISELAAQLQEIVEGERPASGSGSVQSDTVWSSVRLAACKLLDAWITCRSSGDSQQTPLPEDSDEDAGDEDAELVRDERVFRECLGATLDRQLEQRLTDASLQLRCGGGDPSRSALSVADTDNGDDDDDPDLEGDGSAASRDDGERASQATESSSSSQANSSSGGSGGSRQLLGHGKKRLVQAAMRHDPLGSVLQWLLCLQHIDVLSLRGWSVRARCGNYLRRSGLLQNALLFLLHAAGDLLKKQDVAALLVRMETLDLRLSAEDLKRNEAAHRRSSGGRSSSIATGGSVGCGTLQQLALYGLFRSVCVLPAMFRSFWNDDCTRQQKQRLSQFVEERVRSSLLSREMGLIAVASAAGRWSDDEFRVRGSAVSGEVVATFVREETSVEIRIRLPPSYPLRNVEVSCTSKIGVSEGRWRRWVLQMTQLLSLQDGSVVDAALMWKRNIERELEGAEPCPICYCVLHTKTLSLPALSCPTCNNKFHNTCLYTWFKSSGKSKCVICQQPFFSSGAAAGAGSGGGDLPRNNRG